MNETTVLSECLSIIDESILPTDTQLAKNLMKELLTLYIGVHFGPDYDRTVRRLGSLKSYISDTVEDGEVVIDLHLCINTLIGITHKKTVLNLQE